MLFMNLAEDRVDKAVWLNYPLSLQVLGNEDIIDKISLVELINYKKEIF